MNILNLFVDTQRVKNMTRGFWIYNSNRLELRSPGEIGLMRNNSINKFLLIMENYWCVSKDQPLLLSREAFNIEEAREIWKRVITHGWRRNKLFD